MVLQATGNHAWAVAGGWENAARKLGVLHRVFRPRAQWGEAEPRSDDGLYEYLARPEAEVLLLPGLDWHSQMLHSSPRWLERWRQSPALKVLYVQESVLHHGALCRNPLMEQCCRRAAGCVDLIIYTDLTDRPLMESLGKPAWFQPFGVDVSVFANERPFAARIPRAFFRGKHQPFAGQPASYASRRALIQHLLERQLLDLLPYQDRPVAPTDLAADFNRYQVAANFPSVFSNHPSRVYEAMACGCAVVTNRTGEERIDRQFEHGTHLLYYASAEELAAAVQRLGADPAEAARLASAGCRHILQNYALDKLLGQILGWADEAARARPPQPDRLAPSIPARPAAAAPLPDPTPDQPRPVATTLPVRLAPTAPAGGKLLIDGVIFQLQHRAPAGIWRVWTSLLRELGGSELAKDILLLDRSNTAPAVPGIETRPCPAYDHQRFESDSLRLEEFCRREQARLFISTYYTFPEQTHSMVMLHDMIPEATGQDLSLPEWRAKTKAIQKACAYFCVSNSTSTDFRKLMPELRGRPVYLTPNAVGDEFRRASQREVCAFCARFKIAKPYFLVVGHRTSYKNAQLFFRAFASWDRCGDFAVVCAGGAPELERGLQSLIHGLPCHLLALTNEELAAAYSGATALVYPSRYEGFGLPVLEAQKCGCPVITCRNSSLPEVAGQAALFVDAIDVAGLQAAMDQVLDPLARGRLAESGLENVRRFSWGRTARAMVQAIQSVLSDTSQVQPRSAGPLDTAERFAWGLARNKQEHAASQLLSYTEMALNRRCPDLGGMARLERSLSPLLAGAHRAFMSLPDANGESDGLLCFFQGLALEHRKELQPALKAYLKAFNAMSFGLAREFRIRLGLRLGRVALELNDRNVCEQVLLACVLPLDAQNAEAHELLGLARGRVPAGKGSAAPPGTSPVVTPAPALEAPLQAPGPQPSARGPKPLVSALVSTYKSERFMRGCLEDLENQTIADQLEIIVVDSASPENERAIVEEFQSRYSNIVYLRTEERETLSAAWNRAVKVARGQYLTTANTDDRHRRDALEILARTLDEHPEVTLVYADCRITRVENQTFETATGVNHYRWLEFNRADLLLKGCFVGPQPLWRRQVHEEHGFFDPSFVAAGDYEFWLRIARTREFLHVPEALGLYLESPGSVEHTNAERGAKEAAEARARHASALLEGNHQPKPDGGTAPGPHAPPPQPEPQAAAPKPQPAPHAPLALPPCALLGQLGPVRELLRRRKLPEAWAGACAAINARPFHPEAWLLLAEIASAAGAPEPARQCARQAGQLAPGWRPAKKFLQGRLRGNAKPAWLVLPELAANRPPRLSVCLIARNEEQFLPQCLASVRGVAAQIVLLDTGSTDRTVALAVEAGAEVHHFPWCDDFSAARNAALKHVTGDWVLVLDADEELPVESREPLRRLMEDTSAMAWRLPIIDVGREDEGCSYVPRLFRNAPALFYVGRVHEQVFSSIEVRRRQWGLDNRLGDAALRHYGYRPEVVQDRNKVQRNLRLLERALAELPGEPNLHMSYGLELARSGDREKGVVQYLKAFDLMSAQPASMVVPELRETLLTQLSSQLTALKRWDDLVGLLNSPLAQAGGLTASLHFALGLAHLEQKQFSEAADQMRQCLAKREQPALAPINKEIHRAGPRHCLALCLDQLGQPEAAAQEFRRALDDDPGSRPARLDYAGFQAAHGQPVQALNLYCALARKEPQDTQPWLRGGCLALSAPEFLEVALDWTCEAQRYLPADLAIAHQRAEALTLAGQCEPALPLWRRVAAAAGPPAQAQAFAATVLCETASGQDLSAPPPALETAVSREFVAWYRRLVRFHARAAVEALHSRLEALQGALPSAGRLLAAALAEVQAAPSR